MNMTSVELEATGPDFAIEPLLDMRLRARKAIHAIAGQVKIGMVLGEDDIFFIDIGPVDNGYEGDGGDTFVVGTDPEHHKAKHDAKEIWDEIRAVWFNTQLTGQELYARAEEAAAGRGWRLNLDLSGHRLSEFPHSAHYDGPLADVDFRPSQRCGSWRSRSSTRSGSSAPSTKTSSCLTNPSDVPHPGLGDPPQAPGDRPARAPPAPLLPAWDGGQDRIKHLLNSRLTLGRRRTRLAVGSPPEPTGGVRHRGEEACRATEDGKPTPRP